jgi:peptidoglycan/xylan/chitin deacetylase (PgdA/CDA1 family)
MNSLIRNYFSGFATIFMLHRVSPFDASRLTPNENMKVSPDFLEGFIKDMRADGYSFISIDRLHAMIANREIAEKQIIFTLDDGYKDNFTSAYPIFKKYDVPFTVYITSSFPEKKAYLWWYALEDLLLNHSQIALGDGTVFACKSQEEKLQVFFLIRKIIMNLPQVNFLNVLENIFSRYTVDWVSLCESYCMDWSEIEEMSNDEICTIGSHTANHLAMNKLSAQEIRHEVLGANRLIELMTNKRMEHFAYPFGGRDVVGKREFDIIKGLNFKTSTTTRRGTIYLEHSGHLEALPRIMLTENFSNKDIGKIRKKRIVIE